MRKGRGGFHLPPTNQCFCRWENDTYAHKCTKISAGGKQLGTSALLLQSGLMLMASQMGTGVPARVTHHCGLEKLAGPIVPAGYKCA